MDVPFFLFPSKQEKFNFPLVNYFSTEQLFLNQIFTKRKRKHNTEVQIINIHSICFKLIINSFHKSSLCTPVLLSEANQTTDGPVVKRFLSCML